ncbi:hypothetical protein J2X69_005127, partial [Algoriphagus sp. 4150]|uniref:condensation domain-containing protein n=1 Tax=Algoriphagus sp. 4150 TaxID=2817756 RepID=UPI00285F2E1C
MGDIFCFFKKLKVHHGAIWLDADTIRLIVPKHLQNDKTKQFIAKNKSRLKSILFENHIFSKDIFLGTTIFSDRTTLKFPLSFAQKRLWFIEQYEQGSNAYHTPTVLELAESSNIEALKYGLQQIVARHDILRTTIEWDSDLDVHQIVHDQPLIIKEIVFEERDDHESLITEDINRPFDLSSEYPVRVKFYKKPVNAGSLTGRKETVVLLIDVHHIASDGWSSEIFQRELFLYYEAYERNDTG